MSRIPEQETFRYPYMIVPVGGDGWGGVGGQIETPHGVHAHKNQTKIDTEGKVLHQVQQSSCSGGITPSQGFQCHKLPSGSGVLSAVAVLNRPPTERKRRSETQEPPLGGPRWII